MHEETRQLTDKRDITSRTFLVYTGLFLVMVSAIYSYFVWTNTSFIWQNDGFTQHYQLFFDYISKIRGWVTEGNISLWDWNIGLGADIIHSYGYYAIGDPFVYLALLFPSHLMEAAYHILILLRIWAIGISFLFFVRSQHLSHHAGLASAIAYAFTHFVIFNVTRHPFFLLPLIWFPLLCLGIDKILKGDSSRLFMVAVTVSALSNFYFFYKLTLLTVLYALVRFAYLNKKWDWASFTKVFLKAAYAYGVGLLISASLFLPMVFGFLDSSRQAGELGINLLFYPLEYYLALVQHTVSPGSYFWLIGGFPILSIFGFVYIWKKPDYRFIRTTVIVLFVLALFPFFGSMMNGFSGPYNRFSFALPFFFSLALAHFMDQREHMDKDYLQKMRWVLVLFSVLSFITWVFIDGSLPYMTFPVTLGWVIWGYLKLPSDKKLSHFNENRLVVVLVMLNLTANALYYYYPFGMNKMDSSIEYGTAEEAYQQVLADGPEYLPDRGLDPYRVGVTSQDNHVRNQFLYLDVMGLNSYLSITNGYVSDFAKAIETAGFQVIQPLRNGIDDRRIANHLLGVRYIITDSENESYLPFGYEVVEELSNNENEQYILAETTDAYPFAYAIGNAISEKDFMELNAVEREAALVENVVLEESVHQEFSLEKASNESAVKEIRFEVKNDENETISLPDDEILIEEENTQFTLVLEDPDELIGHEWFIRLDGLDYRPFEQSPWLRQSTNYRLAVNDGQQRKSIYQSDQYSFSSYFHRENMLFNMGYVTENDEKEQVDIVVDQAGIYALDEIAVYAVPVSAQEDERIAAEKRERALDIKVFSDERLEGEIIADANELLVTAIPFSAGWSVMVNGEERDVLNTNLGFVGVELTAGENNVQFTYRTPYLRLGMGLTLVGIILAALNMKSWGKTNDEKSND
ncbi:YfhO family protein [Alkalibacterium sp. f15]|uniref:YfhO family protein n=1 Tax=Alkalibacterium sp. f15 TaxID=3414029 RepID=UPI003BF8A88F